MLTRRRKNPAELTFFPPCGIGIPDSSLSPTPMNRSDYIITAAV